MLTGTCHCGAVEFSVAHAPEQLTSCNCSICHRLGALWAYFKPAEVTFAKGREKTVPYIQGDKTLSTHHCPTCGCTTHWQGLDPKLDRMAVNARLFPRKDIEGVRIRRFDGAEKWEFLD